MAKLTTGQRNFPTSKSNLEEALINSAVMVNFKPAGYEVS